MALCDMAHLTSNSTEDIILMSDYEELTSSSAGKAHHYSRKDSADSGISGNMSRKTSTTSQLSCSSIAEEPTEETIKEETVFVEPDDDLCEKITQQVGFLTLRNLIIIKSII